MQQHTTEQSVSIPRSASSPLSIRKVGAGLVGLLIVGIAAPCMAGEPSESATSGSPEAAPAAELQPAEPAVSPAEAKKKAKEHFETGLRLYEDGDYSLALIEFERAYSYVPDFRVLYNIGQVSIQLGRYARASQALQQYLKNGGTKVPAARVSAVHNDLTMLEGRTAHLTVKSNIEGAEVLLDDQPLGKTPIEEAVLVDAGEHRLTLRKAGYVSRTEPLVLAGRDESSLQVDLSEEPKIQTVPDYSNVQQPAQPLQPPPVAPAPPPRKNELLYVGWGATGLLAAGWAVTGVIGIKAASDLHNELNRPSTADQLDSLKVKARGWLLASDILGAAALVTGGTTLYFTIKHSHREQPTPQAATVKVGVGPGSVLLKGDF